MTFGQRYARLVTDLVSRQPWLWAVFRRPLARMFDRLAPRWDGRIVTAGHLAALTASLDRIDGSPARILDIGTGTGGAARVLATRWPQAAVTGVDFSEAMIAEARTRAGSDRETYLPADASALPFADGSFDLVAQLNMIPFYDELARVTAPGGTAVIAFSEGPRTPIWVPPDRSRGELARRGFADFEEIVAGSGSSLLAIKRAVS